jgi:hypothetical protein
MKHYRRRNPVSPHEIAALLAAAAVDKTARGARDAAAIALLYGVGANPAELSALDYADYDCDHGRLRLWRNAPSERQICLPSEICTPLSAWAEARGSAPGPLFHPIARPDRILARRLSQVSFLYILERRAQQAGVAPFSPDDIARTHSLLLGGQWKTACCRLVPADYRSFPIYEPAAKLDSPGARNDSWSPPVVRYLRRLIPVQRAEARQVLDDLAQALGGTDASAFLWERLQPDELPTLEELRQRLGHSALNRAKRALNGVLREAVFLGLMPSSDYVRLRNIQWNSIRPNLWADGPVWSDGELLFGACQRSSSAASKRDGALFALIWSEQIGVKAAISFPNDRVVPSLDQSSGSRPLRGIVREAIIRWRSIRGKTPGPFLNGVSRSGEIVPGPMSPHAVEWAFRRGCLEAGIAQFGADDLRRLSFKYHLDFATHQE